MRAKFGVLQQTQGLHLQAKFHLNVFIVSASGGQKPQFWTNFNIFGSSCTDPLLPMRVKFGVLEQIQGLHLWAKFHQNVFIVSDSDGQKPPFWANFDIFGGFCTDPLLPMRVKFGVLEHTHGIHLPARFRLDRFILSSCGGENPQFLPFFFFFGLRHLVMSPIGISLRKLSTGAQLQTFPYPTASELLMSTNAFMATSGAQTFWRCKRLTDRKTNKKLNVF